MGMTGRKERSVKLVIDGVDEFDVRLDNLESKFDDVLVLIKALSEEIANLKTVKAPAKKTVAKKTTKKKAVK